MSSSATPPPAQLPSHGAYPRAQAAVVFHNDWREALHRLLCRLPRTALPAPDLAILFASSNWADDYHQLIPTVRAETGARTLIGASARGIIAGADAQEAAPGIALLLLWLPGARLTTVRLHPDLLACLHTGDGTHRNHLPPPEHVNGWLIFAEPFRMDAQAMLVSLRKQYPRQPMVGAMASTLSNDHRAWAFLNDTVLDEGGVALGIGGPYQLDPLVGQGAEPIGRAWTITGVEGNRITSISNRRPLDVMRETVDTIPDHLDPDSPVMIGFPMSEYQDRFDPGDFVIRGIIHADDATGVLTIGGIPRVGQSVQFHVRDARSAATAFRAMLDQERDSWGTDSAVAAVLCTCRARGSRMFGAQDRDATEFHSAMPDLPVAGMYSFGEIGPVCGVPALNSLAVSVGVIRYAPAENHGADLR